jgi:mycothiol synthase
MRILVDPERRRRGLGTALLGEAEALARSSGNRVLQGTVDGTWRPGRAFAEARGFDVFVRNLLLERDASPASEPTLDASVRLREYRPSDEHAWAAMHNATLIRDREFAHETAESLASQLRSPDCTLWLAEVDAPVGYCFVQLRGERGYVHEIGVLAAWSGRGIGAALLCRGIETLRKRGATRIALATEDDNDRAQRLYARRGFVLARDTFTMRRRVPYPAR